MREVPRASAAWAFADVSVVHAAGLAGGGGEGVADATAESEGEMSKVERNRGSWYGKWRGKIDISDIELPVGHSTYMRPGGRYVDPGGARPFNQKWRTWAADVKRVKMMIIQKDKLGPELDVNGVPIHHCIGYVGVFEVDNVVFDEEKGFSCDLIRRLDG